MNRIILLLAALLISNPVFAAEDNRPIRFGILPVLQALPLLIADEQGLFAEHGIDVELISFATAAEKSIALAAGSIDGEFADLITPMVEEGNGHDIVIVATGYDSSADRPMFALLGRPGGDYQSPADLQGQAIAISSNSVIDYVTETMMAGGSVSLDEYEALEMKNIGLRLQMLLSGQCEAATLPEPLASLALLKGATLIVDDTGIAASQTTLVFRDEFAGQHPESVRSFLLAIEDAHRFIAANPEAARKTLVERTRLPEPLQQTYPLPVFPAELTVPGPELVLLLAGWLEARGAIDQVPQYEDVVSTEYLPVAGE